jgi:hypothetical protein
MTRRTWFRRLLSRLSAPRSGRPAGRRRSDRLQLEALEGRCLPSVNVFLSGRVLHAEGDNNGNFVELDHGGSTTLLASVPVNDSFFDSIVINPGNGPNAVLVSGTVKATTINTGRNSDRIDIGEPVDTLDMRAPIAVNGQGGGVKTLNYNDQANGTPALTYTLSATGTAAGRVQRIGLADLTYGGITNLTVNTGTVGNQTVKVLSTAFPTSTTVNGGRGNNTFIVGDTTDRLQTVGLLTVNGGSGQHNLLSFRDMGTTVPATYGITPTFVDRPLGGAIATLYSNIGTLVVSGGRGGNTFIVNGLAAGTATFIDAGAGNNNNIFVGSGQLFDQGDLSVTGEPPVNGGPRTNRLVLDDRATPTRQPYSLTGAAFSRNGTATVRYGAVDSLVLNAGGGGNTVTAANLGALSATVNTGAGGDAVTVFGFQPAPLAVNDPSGTASLVVDEGFVTSPQNYTVTATTLSRTGAAPLTYSGLGSVQLFTAHGANTVALNSTAAGTDTQVTTGSAGNTFRMGAGPFNGTLTLNGGGTDKLDYSQRNGNVYVNLQTGEATNLTAFSGIRDVTGGHGNNILVGDGHGNTLTGDGPGRNLLIAGGSDFSGRGDTLIGGNDDDILIAGFTAYDTDRASLEAILAAWTRPDSYLDRVAALTPGAGVPLLDATTVFSNGAVNTLVGNAGFDLFFANPDRDRTDADPEAEVVVQIF